MCGFQVQGLGGLQALAFGVGVVSELCLAWCPCVQDGMGPVCSSRLSLGSGGGTFAFWGPTLAQSPVIGPVVPQVPSPGLSAVPLLPCTAPSVPLTHPTEARAGPCPALPC